MPGAIVLLLAACLALMPGQAQAQPKTAVPTKDWSRSSPAQVRQAAEQGDASAQFQMGRLSELGSGVPRNPVEAARFYRLAAEQGHAMAQNNLGHLYHQGVGVPKNPTEAVKWYRLSAEQGEAYGQANLGWMYLNGVGVPRDREMAGQWLRQAADQGFAEAQFLMGTLAERQPQGPGQTVLGNFQVASEWYEKAAAQDHVQAMFKLGDLYYYGKLGHNHPLAAKWFRAAAGKGHDEAVMRLGRLYRDNHKDLPQDHAEAIRWYGIAARKGNAEAQYQLGCLLLEGRGVEHNPAEAERWLRQAAQRGYAEAAVKLAALKKQAPEAALDQVNREELEVASYRGGGETRLLLARAYEEGKGGDVDLPAAAEGYWRILNLGPDKDRAEAARRVIALFAAGKLRFNPAAVYGPKDREHFARLLRDYRRHIMAGDAQYQVGEMFLRGEFLPEDKPQAVEWLTRAAQQGNAPAMNRLGELWAAGVSGQPDPGEAAQWYRRAATNGFAPAQFNLGQALQKGEGVPLDRVEAAAWLSLAAEQNAPQAHEQLASLRATLSSVERQKADARARELAGRATDPP